MKNHIQNKLDQINSLDRRLNIHHESAVIRLLLTKLYNLPPIGIFNLGVNKYLFRCIGAKVDDLYLFKGKLQQEQYLIDFALKYVTASKFKCIIIKPADLETLNMQYNNHSSLMAKLWKSLA